ncbi:MAG: DNA replication and repair protein RecF [Anaerolineae bacterium]|nr:DNA replication and repair protein RecF [Anaerolineae bacterium]
MHIDHLSLTNFRAFSRLDLDVPRRVLLVGDNAQGKTTVLEAIYFLATFTSFHAPSDRQLINFLLTDEALVVARLVAEFERKKKKHTLEVRLIQEINGSGQTRLRKEILLDGSKKQVHDALGAFNAVIFEPQMMRILEGAPEERRRYLNMALAQVVPSYARNLSDYQQALSQRNALLKLLAERGGDQEQLAYWDGVISQHGAAIVHARIHAIEEIERQAVRVHDQLTNSAEVFRMDYQPAFDPLQQDASQYKLPLQVQSVRSGLSLDEIQAGFSQRLRQLRGEEIARGVTTIGPHRDELRILCNGVDLGDFGSRGQLRTALLSLKLAETGWMKEKSGDWPVLLLDEVLVELDDQRRDDLQRYLAQGEQVLMTTTDLKLFQPLFVSSSALWQVSAGKIEQQTQSQ